MSDAARLTYTNRFGRQSERVHQAAGKGTQAPAASGALRVQAFG